MAPLVFPVLVLVLCYGLGTGRTDLVVYVLPVLGLGFVLLAADAFSSALRRPDGARGHSGGLVVAHAVARQWLYRAAATGMARRACGNPPKAF